MDPTQKTKYSNELCRYMAHVYRQRREELGLTKEEVAALINKPVSIVTKSENSFRIGINEVFMLGEDVYGLDMIALLEEAEEHIQTVLCDRVQTTE